MSSDPDDINKIVVAVAWRTGSRTPAWSRLWEKILRDVLRDDRGEERETNAQDETEPGERKANGQS